MAFKTFTDGVTLPASDLNTYLMKQAVIVCTSGSRPSSPVEGMRIAETDTDREYTYSGSAWVQMGSWGVMTSFTPSLQASGGNPTLGSGSVSNGRYTVVGKVVDYQFYIAFGTSGASAGAGEYYISLPVTANVTVWPGALGPVMHWDAGGVGAYAGTCELATTSLLRFRADGVGNTTRDNIPFAWGTGADFITGTARYQAA